MKSENSNLKNSLFPKPQSLAPSPLRSGFTLVEMLVAIGIFSVVISVAVGGFVRALRTERQVVALIAANSNASLAIEQIAREIRTSIHFSTLGASCGSVELAFTNAHGEQIVYRRSFEGVIERGVNGDFAAITGNNITIQYLSFCIAGEAPNDGYPPRVTISLGVSPKALGVAANITNIQMTVSARQIDS